MSKDVSAAQKSFAIKDTQSMLVCWGIILGGLWIKDGIVVSLERNKFEFYGGAMDASNFSDFLSPSWLLQFFKRYSWDLDSITSCKKGETVHESYYLCVTSTKGNVKIELSEGKVDEAVAVLVSLCNMGTPILNR